MSIGKKSEPGYVVNSDWDIVIVGGGPAGSAAAITLRQVAPELAVALFAGEGQYHHRMGETVPAVVRDILEQLGVWQTFLQDSHVSGSGTLSSWGGQLFGGNDFIYSLSGYDWHVDRPKFDEMLLKKAAENGAAVFRRVKALAVSAGSGHCEVKVNDPGQHSIKARFVIDASGRSAFVSRRLGGKFLKLDRLIGIYRLFSGTDFEQARTIIEPCPLGWWYSTGLRDSAHVVALMTDGDIAAKHRLHDPVRWTEALRLTGKIKFIATRSTPLTLPQVRPAHSGILDPAATEAFLAVGDAVSAFDPLSSLGILKGLRSGILGGYAAADWIMKGDTQGLCRYREIIQCEFKTFLKQRASYYAIEKRWHHEEFWRRRHFANVPLEDALPRNPELRGLINSKTLTAFI